MPGRSATTEQIRKACEKFLKSRGEGTVTFREVMDRQAQNGKKMRKLPPVDPMEKVAQEIENNSKE